MQTPAEAIAARSPMERFVQRAERLRFAPLLISVLIAIVFAAVASLIAIRFAQQYHNFTMYYPDSSGYRQQAVLIYQTLHTQGFGNALRQALVLKDGLDVLLRVLFWPGMLEYRFGHMVVVMPFMAGFIFVTIWYVYSRTGSLSSGLVVVGFLFTAGLIYGPYAGIADYWKDSLGTWLLGGACITWLLAEQLRHRTWACICGLCLGLLVAQRTGAAIYAAPLFGVLFLSAVYQRIRLDQPWQAFNRVVSFVLPAIGLAGVVILFQLNALYRYYFGFGYAYGSMQSIMQFLLANVLAYGGAFFYLVPIAGVICLFSISTWRGQVNEIVVALWLVLGFPAFIIISRSAYVPGFFACWTLLLIVFLASAMPRGVSANYRSNLLMLLLIIVLGGAAAQYTKAAIKVRQPDAMSQATRGFYLHIANVLLAQPVAPPYELLFSEVGADFSNLLYFDLNREKALALHDSPAFISVHDSYYRAAFGDLPAERIAQQNIAFLEQTSGTIVVADCSPKKIAERAGFAPNPAVEYLKNGNPLAAQVIMRMSEYVLQSPHWRAIDRLDSPFGCMYVYQYVQQPLNAIEKWQAVSFSKALAEIPLGLSLAPLVQVYDYAGQYSPENVNGIYYQWLPSGSNGLHITLFSRQARRLSFQAHAIPGQARRDSVRTIVVSVNGAPTSTRLASEQDISIPLSLQEGINQIDLSIQESADAQPQPGADPRELMLLLVSPHLAPAPE